MSAKTVFMTQYELTCENGDDKVWKHSANLYRNFIDSV